MKTFFSLTIFFLFSLSVFCDAAQIFPQKNRTSFTVDDYEDGNLNVRPLWWQFGAIDVDMMINRQDDPKYVGRYSMKLSGESEEWYIGGVGTYFGIDARGYNALKVFIHGKGEHSGTLLFELYDDDNNNWELEQHTSVPSQPAFDDRFVYTKKVDWKGWRVVTIPLSHFSDVNPNIGDGKWNPYHRNGSGGLLQLQIILMASDKFIEPEVSIDTVRFVRVKKKIPPPKRRPQFTDWI